MENSRRHPTKINLLQVQNTHELAKRTPQSAPKNNPLTPQPTWTCLVTLKIYLVEDNPTIRDNLIATLVELANVEAVGTSDNENDGKQWLLNNPEQWDLAILDLFLKQGSGLGVLAACRDRKPTQKIVVLSNYATADIRQRCAQLGVDAVFDKSNEIDALLDYCRLQNDALG
jgi:DNA-binding NarL/FixJ family response regulator